MYSLFIDESGKADLHVVNSSAPHFSLAGVIVHDSSKNDLKVRADQIKFKYWGKTDIVFHANQLRHQTEDFAIFASGASKFSVDDFFGDFCKFLNANYKIGIVSINKQTFLTSNPGVAHAVSQLPNAQPGSNWLKQVRGTSNNLIRKASTELVTMYLDYLNKKSKNTKMEVSGQVMVESSNEVQDLKIYTAYNDLLTRGFQPFGMNTTDVRNRLTGISFVTKQNYDIESQLSDIAAHYLNLEAKFIDGIIGSYPMPYDEEIIKILKSKSFFYKKSLTSVPENSFLKLF